MNQKILLKPVSVIMINLNSISLLFSENYFNNYNTNDNISKNEVLSLVLTLSVEELNNKNSTKNQLKKETTSNINSYIIQTLNEKFKYEDSDSNLGIKEIYLLNKDFKNIYLSINKTNENEISFNLNIKDLNLTKSLAKQAHDLLELNYFSLFNYSFNYKYSDLNSKIYSLNNKNNNLEQEVNTILMENSILKDNMDKILREISYLKEKSVTFNKKIFSIEKGLNNFEGSILKSISKKKLDFVFDILNKTGFSNSKLLYDTTEHGDSLSTFHKNCDDKGPTIIVVQTSVDKKKFIFGGFTSLSWKSDFNHKQNYSDSKAFLFSIDKEKIIEQSENSQFSITTGKKIGPCFGNGYDMYISENCCSNKVSYHELKNTFGKNEDNIGKYYFTDGTSSSFTVDSYEVYELF